MASNTTPQNTSSSATSTPSEGSNQGPSSSATPYVLAVGGSGVRTTSILTTGDAIGSYVMAGIPDGLGAFDNNDGTFTLLMNQELGATTGATRLHGGKGAFVSSWIINKSSLTVQSGADLIRNVYGWNATTQTSNTTPNSSANGNGISFNRFCSADLATPTAFYNPATGLGTQARLFLNGEEGGANGFALANVASGANAGSSFILGKFNLSTNGSGLTGVGGWENLLANPKAQDKTVVIGNNDGGTGIMTGSLAVYQGTKTASGSDADKAGLTNGAVKFVTVNGITAEIADSTTRATAITSGSRFSLSSTASTTFSRPEDGAWDPNNPNRYYFVTTDRLDSVSDGVGTQIGQTRLWRLTFDDISNPDLGGSIDLLIDGDIVNGQKVNMFDNITIDRYGHVLLQEDVGNAAHNGKIWQYDIASDSLKLLTKFDPARFGDINLPATAPFTVDEETSGIIDVQDILGAGWFLLDAQAHYPNTNPDLVEGGQILALFNPDTYTAAHRPTIGGAISGSVREGTAVTADGKLTFNGQLTISDPDAGESRFLTNVSAAVGSLGRLVITESGSYSYVVDNNLPAVQSLKSGQSITDAFTVTSWDGSATQTISIAINGASAGFNAVAAGDPTSDGAVLWTRTYDLDDASRRTGLTQPVTVKVSTSASLTNPLASISGNGSGVAHDYTVKIEGVNGLSADTTYYYQFETAGGERSAVGTFHTAPAAGSAVPVRFGHSGDLDGLMRPYPLSKDIAAQGLGFFINNGDTIYETASTGSVATPATKDAVTGTVSQAVLLAAYQRKYLENLLPSPNGGNTGFSGLKDFFAAQANYTALDNHELGNKGMINGGAPASLATSSANGSTNAADDVNTTGTFINDTTTFDTLIQAYSDYQPIRMTTVNAPGDPRSDGELKLYNSQRWGANVQIINLDTRSFRDVRLNKLAGTSTTDDTGPRADAPGRTLLGATQKDWLKQTLLAAKASGTTWTFINSSDPIDITGAYGSGDDGGKSWFGGYRAERNEILKFIADQDIRNVVFLASDDHTFRVNELTYMPDPSKDPANPANYQTLKQVFSIVDGPLGATGPNILTDHSFAAVKAIADAMAAKQAGLGLNPIGLAPSYPGLMSVSREGDSTAGSKPTSVDFVSPDTFNYTTFDVAADGQLTVVVRGINSYQTNTFPEPSDANPAREVLRFSIDPSPAEVSFAKSTVEVLEPATVGTLINASVEIRRSGDTSGSTTVQIAFDGGSATGGPAAPSEGSNQGPSSSATPYVLAVGGSGVRTTSILTTGDAIGSYVMAGIPDGLGAFDNNDGTFTLLMNQELGATTGATRLHGGKGAFVSSWIINKSSLTVQSGADLIRNVYGWNATTQTSNTTPNSSANGNGISFNRFCSADLATPTAFYNPATGLGTQARLFLNGEEGGANGFALANVASGANAGSSFILGKFNLSTNGSGLTGVGGWENLLANPKAQDKTVVIGNNDGGTGIMTGSLAVYQGTKTASGSDADKAGLTNGAVKFVTVNGITAEIADSTTRATAITSGSRFSLSSTASTTFSRPEDGAWDPNNPNRYYFVTTDRLDSVSDGVGTQIGQTRLWRLTFDDISNPDLGGSIDLLIDGDIVNGQKVNMFDNITIDRYGHVLLQEDVGNAAHNGKIWQYDIASDSLKLLTKFDPARFGDINLPATAPFTVDEETSGIIDVQDILGAGWFLLDAQAHYPNTNPDLVEGGQILALFNPDTMAKAIDYINAPQGVTFAPGETTKSISIPVLGDAKPEPQESIRLKLVPTPGSGTALGSVGDSQVLINDRTILQGPINFKDLTNEGGTIELEVDFLQGRLYSSSFLPVTGDFRLNPTKGGFSVDLPVESRSKDVIQLTYVPGSSGQTIVQTEKVRDDKGVEETISNAGRGILPAVINNYVHTREGDDRITGSDGIDFIRAGAGNDWIDAGGGDDIVRSGSGNDDVRLGAGRDLLLITADQLAGSDRLFDFSAEDRLVLADGIKVLSGLGSATLQVGNPGGAFQELLLTGTSVPTWTQGVIQTA